MPLKAARDLGGEWKEIFNFVNVHSPKPPEDLVKVAETIVNAERKGFTKRHWSALVR